MNKVPPVSPDDNYSMVSPKGNYGTVSVNPIVSLFDKDVNTDTTFRVSKNPPLFEELNQRFGFVLYETVVPPNVSDPPLLEIPNLNDRAIIFLNQKPVGVLSRMKSIYSMPLFAHPGQKLSILVENQGRVNFGSGLRDLKGMLTPPKLSKRVLGPWNVTGFPFEDIKWLHNLPYSKVPISPPAFYEANFVLPKELTVPLDTYVDMSGWGKGVLFINDFNLGRYWPSTGPQVTLYVPGCYLYPYPNKNIITVFELEYTPQNSYNLQFVTVPILNITPPAFVT